MDKKTEALKLARAVINDTAYGAPVFRKEVRNILVIIDEALAEQPACKYPHCPYPCPDLPDCRDAEQPAQQCNPHPKAPHGFDRNASHSAGRYVCDCESWEPYDAGYRAGYEACLKREEALDAMAEQPAQQEPVARVINKSIVWRPRDIAGLPTGSPLYTSPPATKPWVGLTEDDKLAIRRQSWETPADLIKNTEAKCKEKNA